ncbi:MAG: dTMP kinase [Pseudomonadota bacterium]
MPSEGAKSAMEGPPLGAQADPGPHWPPPAPGALFVTLEGPDGTGKSTQARALAERLDALGRPVTLTREPGGAPGAEAIRALLVTGAPGRWSPVSETLLFTAARRDHVEHVIAPALAAGHVVLCDRYIDSTRAYQGAAHRAEVDLLHRRMIGLDPDLTLILDLDAPTARARAAARETAPAGPPSGEDRFERKGAGFQAALQATFHEIAAAEPERCRIVSASGTPEAVTERLWAVLAPKLTGGTSREARS